jgi:hypothetical protein
MERNPLAGSALAPEVRERLLEEGARKRAPGDEYIAEDAHELREID